MDLQKYNSQIIELVAIRNEEDFNTLFDNILFGESNSDKFLIKMELKRLATPCKRIIDLRDKVKDKCHLFEQQGIKHYLTTEAIDILQENIKLYNQYTLGVFEAVHQFIEQQKIIQFEQSQQNDRDNKYVTEYISLTDNKKRSAPRMYFVSNVLLRFDNGQTLKAKTANISANGIKLKLNQKLSSNGGEFIQVDFLDLKTSYSSAIFENEIQYEIIKQKEKDNKYYLYLKYSDNNLEFTKFIKHFIRTNHFKYKIDVQYYYQQTKIEALKKSYIQQLDTLPIYLNCQSFTPYLFSLINNNNKHILQDWICSGSNQLTGLFSELRFAKLSAQSNCDTLLYCFTHQSQGKEYFISATEEELDESGLKTLFINYGIKKSSWRAYYFTMKPYCYEQKLNYEMTDPLPKTFSEITHMATLLPLDVDSLINKQSINDKDINKLNRFVHHSTHNSNINSFNITSTERRKEQRYLLNSKLVLEVNNKKYTATIIDFSLSGLKIKLDQIAAIRIQEKVIVNLVELQKISGNTNLKKLSYKVVHNARHNTWHLQVADINTFNICIKFFSLLIEKNEDRLKCLPLQSPAQPSHKRLYELAESLFSNSLFYLDSQQIKYAAINHIDSSIKQLIQRYDGNQLHKSLFATGDNIYDRLVKQPLQASTESLFTTRIYVKEYKIKDNWKTFTQLEADYIKDPEKMNLIDDLDKQAKLYVLHFRLTRIKPPSFNNDSSEVKLMAHSSMHLLKTLKVQLANIDAMFELIDITNAVK